MENLNQSETLNTGNEKMNDKTKMELERSKKGRKKKEEAAPGPVESLEDKLIRLSARRVPAAIKRIKYVGNLAAYKPTKKQAEAIIDALCKAVQECESRFQVRYVEPIGFTLPTEQAALKFG